MPSDTSRSVQNFMRSSAISDDSTMKLVIEDADLERSEEIAASLAEALGDIVDDGEELVNIVLGASMFWQIIFQWADNEINGGSESIH